MGRFYGQIGFLNTTETVAGVWTEGITERPYYGDVLRHRYSSQLTSNLNDDLVLSNDISIVADAFAYDNIGYMKYITWNGTKWKITVAEPEYPRIRLSLGGIYNG